MGVLLWILALAVWFVIAVFAFNNRHLRDTMYARQIGAWPAHLVGVVLQVAFIYVVTYLFLNWMAGAYSSGALVGIGVVWLVLTVVTEPWLYPNLGRDRMALLREYNPLQGRLWLLVLLAQVAAPIQVGGYLLAQMGG